jgi:hypothetical protein
MRSDACACGRLTPKSAKWRSDGPGYLRNRFAPQTTLRLRAPRLEQVVVHLVPPVTVFPVASGNDAAGENG